VRVQSVLEGELMAFLGRQKFSAPRAADPGARDTAYGHGRPRRCRKITRARGHFSNDEAALKLVYPVIRNVEKKWAHHLQSGARIEPVRHSL